MVSERHVRFASLLDALPEVGSSGVAQEELRAALKAIVQRVVDGVSPGTPVSSDPFKCPNCDRLCDSARSPYCSSHCREMAAFIRQFRTSFADGVILEPDRQIGMGQALWSLQGGGFPRRQTLVPPKVLTKVIERDGGLCQVCGAPATEIDHTGSG